MSLAGDEFAKAMWRLWSDPFLVFPVDRDCEDEGLDEDP